MANPDNAFGFQLIKTEGKEARVRRYKKTAAIIYPGDALGINSTGDVDVAASGEALIGVAAEYRAAADAEVAVYDDPEAEFMVQASGSFAAADVFLNVATLANAGDSTLKQSNHEIDSDTADTGATLQWKMLGLMNKGENATGANAIVRVKPNNHKLKGGTGTAGL